MTVSGRDRVAAGIATVAVFAAAAAGVYVLGPPSEERARRLDARRADDLRNLVGAVNVYWTRHKRLPASLQALRSEPIGDADRRDPGSGVPYEYRPLAERAYEVCATFERDSTVDLRPPFLGPDLWAHRQGRQCFTQEPATLER
jgi:hypothetical protein